MPAKPRVLFIDDDSFMLKALLRAALRLRPDWTYYLSDDAQHWPSALPEAVVPDLIVSDYLMPDLNGDVVLAQAMALYPQTVRVLMTGDTNEDVVSSVSLQAHFVLSKPFSEQDLQQLFECVDRVRSLQMPLSLRQLLGQADNLPVLPTIIRQLRQVLSGEQADLARAVDLVAHEPVIAARLMQLANSAFLGYSRPTHSLQEALMRLGLRLVEAIVTLMAVDDAVAGSAADGSHRQISERSFRMAGQVRQLAQVAQLGTDQQDLLYVSALLSALGPLSKLKWQQQAGVIPAQINGVSSDSVITVYLLTLWGYPAALCELELAQSQHGASPDPANLRPFLLFICRAWAQGCSREYLQHNAALLSDAALAQALRQLPVLA